MISNVPQDFVREMILKAIEFKASDLHFQTFQDFILVTVHVDQFRMEIGRIESNNETYFKEIKKFFGFKLSLIGGIESKRHSISELKYDFRCEIFPVKDGENISIRLLQRDRKFDLDAYKLPESAKTDLLRAINKTEGLILISGPTGSGKTTLLYSVLGTIDRIQKNVYSVEDPVEYTLPFVGQTAVNQDNNITFSTMARTHLRAKPNVIMIGEIRDQETAKAAVHASNTGHLVFSTVHAANAERVFERLIDLGVNENVLGQNVIFSSAQRLIPRNCAHCLIEDKEGRKIVNEIFEDDFKTLKSVGCDKCTNGYSGVELVFEYIKKNRKFDREFVKSSSMYEQIKNLLREGKVNATIADNLV